MIVHTMGTLKPDDNDRFTYIARLLQKSGASVEIVTSDFEHHKKQYRDTAIKDLHPFTVTFLHENRYNKNISLKRISGHISFAKRLKKFLAARKVPDAVYCAVPPITSARVAANYARENKIRFVIDVQDLWPEGFYIALGNNAFSRAVLKPVAGMVNDVYRKADAVITVSQTYLERVKQVRSDTFESHVVYLGTDGSILERGAIPSGGDIKSASEFRVAYVGNLGHSYDFLNVFIALHQLRQEGIRNIRFMIFGDGILRENVEEWKHKYYENTTITGYLPYAGMMAGLQQCDVALNPIIAGAPNSVVNKVGDYAALALPVVNTQDTKEYRMLLEEYGAGLNAVPEDAADIAAKIKWLYTHKEERIQMGKNNFRLFAEKFDRRKTYPDIVQCLMRAQK